MQWFGIKQMSGAELRYGIVLIDYLDCFVSCLKKMKWWYESCCWYLLLAAVLGLMGKVLNGLVVVWLSRTTEGVLGCMQCDCLETLGYVLGWIIAFCS